MKVITKAALQFLSLFKSCEGHDPSNISFLELAKCYGLTRPISVNGVLALTNLLDLFPDSHPMDPSLCPIPPDFEVQGDISGDFFKYKTVTGYGPWYAREHGYSHRWKNTRIRSANIVIGFQFKIGPGHSDHWTVDPHRIPGSSTKTIIPMSTGDVNLILPRADPVDKMRGVYGLQLKWKDPPPENPNTDIGLTWQSVYKEIPHGTYSGDPPWHYDGSVFNVEHINANLKPILDGKWHGMLAVIWNGTEPYTVYMSLWYNPKDTHNFADYIYLGKVENSVLKVIPPRDPLTLGVEEVDTLGSGLWGRDPFVVEHDLGIRIDEIAPENIEVRNMYAAKVVYVGP